MQQASVTAAQLCTTAKTEDPIRRERNWGNARGVPPNTVLDSLAKAIRGPKRVNDSHEEDSATK